MDRNDAAFVANVLECRIAGARVDLERHAASSFAALLAAAAIIEDRNKPTAKEAEWEPARLAALELRAIAKGGGSVCDQPAPALLEPFVEAMRKLAGEKPVMNRQARQRLIASQPRARRLSLRPRDLVQVGKPPIVIN
jgi:hypothetical protein